MANAVGDRADAGCCPRISPSTPIVARVSALALARMASSVRPSGVVRWCSCIIVSAFVCWIGIDVEEPADMSWLYLMIAIAAEVVGTSFLRASQGFTKPLPSVMVVIGYGLAFFFLSLTLKDIPVGIAYAVWSGAGVTLIAAIGWLFLGQKLDAAAILGMSLIIAGVVVLNLFSKAGGH